MIIIAGFTAGCTDNPFFKDDEITSRSIKGRVALNDSHTPDEIYVWLGGFNVGTRTNSVGDFELSYPLPAEQGSGSGLSDEFTLYFYVVDYYIDSLKILFVEGEIADGQSKIGKDGQLSEEVLLRKLVYLNTAVDPLVVESNSSQVFLITMTMQTDNLEAWVTMKSKSIEKVYYQTGLYIVHDESRAVMDQVDIPGYTLTNYAIKDSLTVWNIGFYQDISSYPAGEYRIVPYLLIQQPGIPDGLVGSIDANPRDFTPDYLDLPFKRNGGNFTVIE